MSDTRMFVKVFIVISPGGRGECRVILLISGCLMIVVAAVQRRPDSKHAFDQHGQNTEHANR